MNFRTQVELPKNETEIRHSERIMLWGSCFAENIGNRLLENKFRCQVNPFGILYNPLSIAEALKQVMEGRIYQKTDLFTAGGQWHSWMHHGVFSSVDASACLSAINEHLSLATRELSSVDWLVVTWGTAYIYALKGKERMIVGNCHKQPDKLFERKRLHVDEIVDVWQSLLAGLKDVNPSLKVLFTVSPIRHAKDGMHGNQLSKATLLLAINDLCEKCPDCYYFPSYELVMDELRDYRFYADDMIHLSSKAIDYIWECFGQCYFRAETQEIIREWEEIRRGLEHKPFHPELEAYHQFLSQIVLKIERIKEKFPYFDVRKEMEQCEIRLKISQSC